MKTKRKWAALTVCLSLLGAMLSGCGQKAEETHTEGDGHKHTEGDGHKHTEGDGHKHKEGEKH